MWDDDDSEWQDMPVLRSTDKAAKDTLRSGWRAYDEDVDRIDNGPVAVTSSQEANDDDDDDDDDDRLDDLDRRRRRRQKHQNRQPGPASLAVHARIVDIKDSAGHTAATSSSSTTASSSKVNANATGSLIDFDDDGAEWREKSRVDEQDYTRLMVDEDPDEDEMHTKTQYLFDDNAGMTPLAQMQTTKTMLTEAQRIAYVGLCRIVTREMASTLRGVKELQPARESTDDWATRIMGRLYQHMEIESAEQRMIEQLAEHGVTSADLVPSLMTTHTVPNPEYDPEFAQEVEEERKRAAQEAVDKEKEHVEHTAEPANGTDSLDEGPAPPYSEKDVTRSTTAVYDDSGDIGVMHEAPAPIGKVNPKSHLQTKVSLQTSKSAGGYDSAETAADAAAAMASQRHQRSPIDSQPPTPIHRDAMPLPNAPTPTRHQFEKPGPLHITAESSMTGEKTAPLSAVENLVKPLPHTLPGVSQTLTAADKTVTLDIRWTILCDLFLAVIADSVYDARSRVLLGNMATCLGLTWMDVVRFERRLIEALELQEGVAQRENVEVLELRKKQEKRSRYIKMGLATLGGGLVIGLSAGLLAPAIGAGVGAALATMGASGASAFLGGTAGAAVITTGGVITGSSIGVRGMARRTKHVDKFDFIPVHNNKRLNVYITVPGFMNGPQDDVRLPFSVLDPVVGDVFSILWEPKTLGQTGNALKILTSEVLSTVGQQALQATLLSAMMTALQWPILLTKLGYLIDNPWSNALDRARQAGQVLAQILINRSLGIRPVSLIGFSLGARVIFYALVALAKAKAFGVVQEVILLGATVSASRKVWSEISGVVSGRFVNGFARNDWLLGYLFRATAGGLNTVAGLRPVEGVPRLENVDITDILAGHMSYRSLMPIILAELGFKTTADSFDEPEDLNARPEREIVTPEMEQARLEQQKKAGWLLGRFKKDGGSKASLDAARRGSTASTSSSKSANASRENLAIVQSAVKEPINDDDAELPPRIHTITTGSADTVRPGAEAVTAATKSSLQSDSPVIAQAQSSQGKANEPAFDINLIRAEIAKDDGSGQLFPRAAGNVDTAFRHSLDTHRTSQPTPSRSVSHLSQEMSSSAIDVRNAQAELERLEAEYDKQTLRDSFDDVRTAINGQADVSGTFDSPHPSYGFANPFAASSANFMNGSAVTTEQGVPSITFANENGHISIANGYEPSPWASSTEDHPSALKHDPWASNEWTASSKW